MPTISPNTSPASIAFKQTVSFSTADQNNNNAAVAEGYVVSGPVSQGVTPISIASGTRVVIPLTTTTGNGAPYLKIWFPSASGNTFYLTYCVANSAMQDGYYDYKTGVPASYFAALRAWINTNPSTGQPYTSTISGAVLRAKSLKFSAYGRTTNTPANAITFYLKFQGTFGGTNNNNNNQSS